MTNVDGCWMRYCVFCLRVEMLSSSGRYRHSMEMRLEMWSEEVRI